MRVGLCKEGKYGACLDELFSEDAVSARNVTIKPGRLRRRESDGDRVAVSQIRRFCTKRYCRCTSAA